MLIKIKEPYWSAWKRFGWPKNTWGIGINKTSVDKAIKNGDILELKVYNMPEKFFITPAIVKGYSIERHTQFVAGRKTILYVIPHTLLQE